MLSPAAGAPLAGVLVADFTRAVTGPFCTMLLADLGARVVKIEEPGSGDETRKWGPPFVDGESTYFLGVNRGKESVALDLKQATGRSAARRLAARADVVVENFRPGVAARLGIGYDDVRAGNPRVVYASISGFGQDGPARDRPGYDLIVQALSGFMRVSSTPGGPPVKAGFPIADILAGLFAGQAILAALYDRERAGQGRYIEVSLLESMLASMTSVTGSYLVAGHETQGMGVAQANITPYQVFRCADADIVTGAPNERVWRRLAEALGHREWIADARYRDNAARNRHRSELVGEIEREMAKRPAAEWLAILERHEVPCAPVATVAQAFAHPQLAARGAIVEVQHSKLGPIRLPGCPMRFAGYQPSYRPPPLLGEHTEAVLAELAVERPDKM
jgi:crotonobetainyl-CoA:carnitine CoA-transferase CaiB-like acyl-CoA transferase